MWQKKVVKQKRNNHMEVLKKSIFFVLMFGCISCNERRQFYLFNNNDFFIYEYSFKDKKGEVEIKISYDKSLSEELDNKYYNFTSPFFKAILYKKNKKIFLFNKKDGIHSVLFDFQGKPNDENTVCLNKTGPCFLYKLDSINYDKTLLDSIHVYKIKKLEDNDKLKITSPYGLESIYVSEKYGILKITEESGLGLVIYNLKKQ